MGETLDMDGSMMASKGDALSFEDMKPEERAILNALQAAHNAGQNVLRIAEIMTSAKWSGLHQDRRPGFWEKAFLEAQDTVDAIRGGALPAPDPG